MEVGSYVGLFVVVILVTRLRVRRTAETGPLPQRSPCLFIAQRVRLLRYLCAGGGQKERGVRQGEGPPTLDT